MSLHMPSSTSVIYLFSIFNFNCEITRFARSHQTVNSVYSYGYPSVFSKNVIIIMTYSQTVYALHIILWILDFKYILLLLLLLLLLYYQLQSMKQNYE